MTNARKNAGATLAVREIAHLDEGSPPLFETELATVFRPVQFLGAKTKVLPALLGEVAREVAPPGPIIDLFTGSSLVGQGLGRRGYRVLAFDALAQSTHFATALLGVGRGATSMPDTPPIVESLARLQEIWDPWAAQEAEAVLSPDPDVLFDQYRRLPQIWRPGGASPTLVKHFRSFVPGESAPVGLVSAHYAGTYFGVLQSMELDSLRTGIRQELTSGCITPWQESVLLTALLSAASECVFSAGKHYAQPQRVRDGKDLNFLRRRILADRSKSVSALFSQQLARITAAALPDSDHVAETHTLERLATNQAGLGRIQGVYADPPYTAQQYSRFYHLPEVICSYRSPNLQRMNGGYTRGLYPVDRHSSRFCSRKAAPQAFKDLFRFTASKNATLFLSYSFSRTGNTGNSRSISLEVLRALLAETFAHVREHEIELNYRQFNQSGCAFDRSDTELLVVAHSK